MNRRRFLAALIATPVVAALAPLLPKNPQPVRTQWSDWSSGMRDEYAYQVDRRLANVKADMTEYILYALGPTARADTKITLERGMRVDAYKLVPNQWYWMEVRTD